MPIGQIETADELFSYLIQDINDGKDTATVSDLHADKIEDGAIEKLKDYFERKGFIFRLNQRDNLLDIIVSRS
ncbi:hypothetical protein [Acinetobacter pollinis]|uniref:hypothetical protein n=1 Tax=Acinetobacter pollinis TaxID=2605270 RepID=UPI0018C240DD|nr:hypothetical protein [Acinetobacter pollinis]MBF7693971.1 hypothetical protein [Acinetobacter pollinis]MBF7701626.1 hypothetical protein [Acinetobacter pollinis]